MIVIKIGGGKGINHQAVFENLNRLIADGTRAIVVHGANHEMKELCERLNLPQRMITSVSGYESRYTDAATMDAFMMAYCGKVNTTLTALARRCGVNAIGMSGVDGGLLSATRKTAIRAVEDGKKILIRDDYSGKIESVNRELLQTLTGAGFVPLVSPPAISEAFEPVNVDGDRAAAEIAGAVGAEKLIILSNVPGLLRDVDDETSLIPLIDRSNVEAFEEFAKGRMRKKIMGAVEAIDKGVAEVVFADARIDSPIDAALNRRGTVIRP
jgi:acetylglutamate/LysW-gamma-L-alpha-aminoadipate kinase